MKISTFGLLLYILFSSMASFSQTPQQIEADLIKPFNKLNYLAAQKENNTTGRVIDSITTADGELSDKLGKALVKYPVTLDMPFRSLADSGLAIATSPDGKLRIYAWDSYLGGQEKSIENIFQFKTQTGTDTLADVPQTTYKTPADNYDIKQCSINGKTYYLIIYESIVSLKYYEGITICTLEKNKLDTNVKLIKTGTGLHNQLNFNYHHSVDGDDSNDSILFDEKLKQITLPLVNAKGELTNGIITYKFTGQYFERVKN